MSCYGFQEAAYHNGKIGHVREIDSNAGECKVHLEDAGLESVSVKRKNEN